MKVLLIDIPSYKKDVNVEYRGLLRARIQSEAIIEKNRIGYSHRGAIPYSRGLLQIGSAIMRFGHQVNLISIFDTGFWQKVNDVINSVDVVGITCMTPSFNILKEITSYIRSIGPHLVIVAGGTHVMHEPIETLHAVPAIDIVIKGEGESTFVDILRNYPNLTLIDNIVFKQNGEIIANNFITKNIFSRSRDFFPAFDLLERPLDDYSHNIVTQRGCKYECDYCLDAAIPFRYSDLSLFMAELKYLEERMPSNSLIYISDDVISSNKKRLLKLCKLISQQTHKFYFVCELRAEDTDEDILHALIDARFIQFNLGFEDANDENLTSVNRNVPIERCLEACELIRRRSTGLIGIHWLTGLPNSTSESVQKNIKLIRLLLVEQALVDIISNKIFVPYPGTKIYQQPSKYGVFIHETDWSNFDRMSKPVYHTNQLSSAEIWKLFLDTESAIIDFYAEVLGLSLAEIQKSVHEPIHSYNKFSYLD